MKSSECRSQGHYRSVVNHPSRQSVKLPLLVPYWRKEAFSRDFSDNGGEVIAQRGEEPATKKGGRIPMGARIRPFGH
jgi:hypothetical protein